MDENFEIPPEEPWNRRILFYRPNSKAKGFINDGDLQIQIFAEPLKKKDVNKILLEKLISHYYQKNQKSLNHEKKLNKMALCRELSHARDCYDEMMKLKKF